MQDSKRMAKKDYEKIDIYPLIFKACNEKIVQAPNLQYRMMKYTIEICIQFSRHAITRYL